MKLATYLREDGMRRIGVIEKESLFDLGGVGAEFPNGMLDLVQGGQEYLNDVRRRAGPGNPIPLGSVRLLAPIPRPPEYLGVGLNYRDHLEEAGLPLPRAPAIFNKQTSCIVGPFDNVVLPRLSDQLDYEGELGIVVGQASRNLSLSQAAVAIFGYVVVNDLSVRDWQLRSPTATLGKSFDSHGPFGPWIVTADEVPDPHKLVITTSINEEIRQRGTTADMIFDCYAIMAFLSRVMTLQPGTIIATGTPAGVGHSRHPPMYLRAGDLVTVNISGLGRLSNLVVAEAESGQQ